MGLSHVRVCLYITTLTDEITRESLPLIIQYDTRVFLVSIGGF